ncbi:PD-(D/E)XK motif protein [Pectobacterium polaris]|uniref:PD-(D/E)XK motif protein n=1 Tax=Pectobacterium polaris TaxID=2042057 RepID=UPI0015822963|nr:PD-(D/E)XK motif protein [Pectobacterium polaris]MDE8743014.1 PD-(D/E)XK motif protein [Pectobacterium polaris]
MARQSEEFILAWLSLSSDSEVPGWQAISLPSAGAVELQAGRRSPDNSEAVLFSFPTARLARAEKLPEGKGFLVEKAEAMGMNDLLLALTRQEDGNLELFTSMVCDVVGAIDEGVAEGVAESGLLRILVRRVLAWQQFMSRGLSPLGPEAELGLMGELYFMTLLFDSQLPPMEVLSAWVGPDDAPQDFFLGEGAIEVKATMSSSGFPVRISSLEQLDDAVASPLFLAALRFARLEEGFTLPEIVAEIELRLRGEPAAVNFFCERLMLVGYSGAHVSNYTRRFQPKEKLYFSISESFPRLTLGSVPIGVTRALYEINLDHAGDFLTELDVVLKKLGVSG